MPLKTHVDEMPAMNLTSMIDVVFLLIVFFMAAAKFTDPARDIDLELPQVANPGTTVSPSKAREVAVYADGRVTLDREPTSLSQLTEQLTASPGMSVVVLGDSSCPFQHIAAALAACRDGGVSNLSLNVRVAQRQAQNSAGAKR